MHPAFRLNALMVYVALVADVLVGAYADINYSSSTQMDVMALIFQACAFLLTTMCFYNMLAETNLVKRAMFSKLAREFSTTLFFAGLYFVFILVSRFYRLALVYNSYPHLQIWEEPGFTGLYTTMKCTAVVYYCAVVWSMQRLLHSPELIATKSSYLAVGPE